MKQTRGALEFVVDLVVENAEAVLLAHRLVGLAHVDVVAPVERGLEGVERAPPDFVPGEQVAERRERQGLRVGRRGMLVGGVGGGRAARDEFLAIVRLGVVGLDRDIGVGEPARRIFRRGGHRGGGELLGGVELACGRGGGSGLAQIVRRLIPG